MIPRIAPFALFMFFIGIDEFLHFLLTRGIISLPVQFFLFLYPIKILVVGFSLWWFRSAYVEVDFRDLRNLRSTFISLVTGIVVFGLWIWMIWPFAVFGTLTGFDPSVFTNESLRYTMVTIRLAGAVIIVPIMEEIFWRSFLIRYLSGPSFSDIGIGQMTATAFIVTTVLFGLEHNLWLAGMMAGVAYNLLLLQTKSIVQCIFAHAVTNFMLGVYVLATKQWFFW
jgi:CAAX prenyl protease-like protein